MMNESDSQNLTQLLVAWNEGDETSLEKLAPLVHSELRRLAKTYMSREREDHVLQTSALINEAYIRLIDWKTVKWQNRAHFFGVAAQMMRRILVDFARSRPRLHENKSAQFVEIEEALTVSSERTGDLIALDEALQTLEKLDNRKSKIVEMRFFGGLSNTEIAEVLQISEVTVTREWNKAKAWLFRELSDAN